MINEEILVEHYTNIAQAIDNMIPWDWKEVVLYGEEEASIVDFYYIPEGFKEYKFCDTIDMEYEDENFDYQQLREELEEAVENLWLEFEKAGVEFEKAGVEPWNSMTFKLNSDFQFSIDYSYEELDNTSWYEREAYWAYKTLGIVPDDEYDEEYTEDEEDKFSLSKYFIEYKKDEYKDFLKYLGKNAEFSEDLVKQYCNRITEILDEWICLKDHEDVVIYTDSESCFGLGIFKKQKGSNKYEEMLYLKKGEGVNRERIRRVIEKIWLEQGKDESKPNMKAAIFKINNNKEVEIDYRYELKDICRYDRKYTFAFTELGYIPEDKTERKLFEEYLIENDKELYKKYIEKKKNTEF